MNKHLSFMETVSTEDENRKTLCGKWVHKNNAVHPILMQREIIQGKSSGIRYYLYCSDCLETPAFNFVLHGK